MGHINRPPDLVAQIQGTQRTVAAIQTRSAEGLVQVFSGSRWAVSARCVRMGGVVFLQGSATRNEALTADSIENIALLPEGFRPVGAHILAAGVGYGSGLGIGGYVFTPISVQTGGTIQLPAAPAGLVQVDLSSLAFLG